MMYISPSLCISLSTFLILNDELSIKLANGILCDAHLHYLELRLWLTELFQVRLGSLWVLRAEIGWFHLAQKCYHQ